MNVGVGSGHGQGYAQLAACSALFRETGMARFLGLLTHELDDFGAQLSDYHSGWEIQFLSPPSLWEYG